MRQFNRGMTLIEVLVAFVLLSLSLAVIFHIFAGGMRNARMAEQYSRAVFLAESKLASVGLERALAVGELGGVSESNLQWRILIEPVDEATRSPSTAAASRRLYQVTVRVGWTEGDKTRQVELKSHRLGPGT